MSSRTVCRKRLLGHLSFKLRRLGTDCDGYLDPGSGSYLLQVAMAGLLGGMFALKSSWASIKIQFRAKFPKRK
jgi:hypothetical protein